MKRSISALLLLLCLVVPVLAGDPGMPPCKANCGQATTATPVPQFVIALLLSILGK